MVRTELKMNKEQELSDRKQDKVPEKNIQKWARSLSSLVAPHPSVKDIGERRLAQLLNIITLILAAMLLLGMFFSSTPGTFITLLLVASASFGLGKTKYYKVGTGLFSFSFIASAYIPLLTGTAGEFESSIYTTVPIGLIVASTLLGQQREYVILATFASLATFFAPFYSKVPTPDVLSAGGIVTTISVTLYGINALRTHVERARLREVQNLNRELTESQINLEQRVADRTRDLEIVAEVGTATATILESKRLLQEVVDLTKERFNLYHSHIYLLDEAGANLVLTAGAGEPGRIMAEEKRSIPLSREQSLVARAARERKGITVNDVTEAPDFLPNPLLPNTRSELAVPMITGGTLIGVFDVQSDQIGRFTETDINIQTILAAQVATSIQNVRSFEQSRTRANLESLVNVIGQKIQRTTTIEEALQTAIREIGAALGASRVKASIGQQSVKDGSSHAEQSLA